MAHHGNTCVDKSLHGIGYFLAAFEFQGICPTLFHHAHGVAESVFARNLVTAERHVAHHKGAVDSPHHRAAMINHLVHGDGHRSSVASHHVGGRITDENSVDSSLVHNAGSGEVVRCEHRDFLVLLFHFHKSARRYLARVAH